MHNASTVCGVKRKQLRRIFSQQCRCNWFTILTKLCSYDTNIGTMELFQIKIENMFLKNLLLFRDDNFYNYTQFMN